MEGSDFAMADHRAGVGVDGGFDVGEPAVGEKAGDLVFHLTLDEDVVEDRAVKFVFFEFGVAGEDDVVSGCAEGGDDGFPEVGDGLPVLDLEGGAGGKALLTTDFVEDVFVEGCYGVDDDCGDVGGSAGGLKELGGPLVAGEWWDFGARVVDVDSVVEEGVGGAEVTDRTAEVVVAVEEVGRWELTGEGGFAGAGTADEE